MIEQYELYFYSRQNGFEHLPISIHNYKAILFVKSIINDSVHEKYVHITYSRSNYNKSENKIYNKDYIIFNIIPTSTIEVNNLKKCSIEDYNILMETTDLKNYEKYFIKPLDLNQSNTELINYITEQINKL